ncbi:LAME_0G11034g1_1 [Lachancea meyersii CBS 8951]|uniref:LAME_0G11034g1_1 n=1 Tax=Lachancea meyersii CBS 8951 TaxID=1266667 RepID=A0A1G4K959_9SACH|nr:LAME_0G11034g1_1 [Lachancea meyersii CBS 8951]
MDSAGDEIIQALARGNGKLALQLSGKLCTRFPKASYPKIMEQYVRFRSNSSKFNAYTMLEPLLEKCSVPSDLRSLELLHKFRFELGQPERALDAYKLAMQKYPSPELGYTWFGKAIEDLNLRHMVQSSFQLRRWSQDPRMVQFWNALSTVALLKMQSNQLNAKEKQLNVALAFKTLEGLKPFQSDQETVVFCHVCDMCENKSQVIVDELLPAFQNSGSEKEFSVDLYLKNFLLKHLAALGDHANLIEVCKYLLTLLDDFGLLKQLIDSAKICGSPRDEIEAVIGIRDSRNHRLAHLHLDAVYSSSISDKSLDFYLERFHDKPCCVPDLTHYKEHLSKNAIEKGLDKFPSGLVHDCNFAKLTEVRDPEHFIALFTKYKSSLNEKVKTDYSSCSYFVLKIVESMINDESITLENVLTSVALLEQYQSLDPYNFDTRVWLIVLYNYLGCPSVAYSHYTQLKVKNLQLDTVDFLMTTRHASLFPTKDHPFYEHLGASDNVYDSADSLPRFIMISFERKSYSKVLGMLELYDKLSRSTGRWSKRGERLQQARLFNDKRGSLLRDLQESWRMLCQYNSNFGVSLEKDMLPELNDNRDFSVLGPMQHTCTKAMAYLRQDSSGVLAASLREILLGSCALGERNLAIERIIQQHGTALTAQMTSSEAWVFKVVHLAYESQIDETKTADLLAHLDAKPDVHTCLWRLAHDVHTQLATLKSLDQLKRIKDPRCRDFIKAQLRQLRERAQIVFPDYISTIRASQIDSTLLQRLGLASYETDAVNSIQAIFKVARNL